MISGPIFAFMVGSTRRSHQVNSQFAQQKSLKIPPKLLDRSGKPHTRSKVRCDGGLKGIAWFLGQTLLAKGDVTTAGIEYQRCGTSATELEDDLAMTWSDLGTARVHVREGHAACAAQLFGAAEASLEQIGSPLPPVDRRWYEVEAASLRSALGENAHPALAAWPQSHYGPGG